MHSKKLKSLPLPTAVWALFVVRLVVSAGAFVGPFLAMTLTMKLGYDEARAGFFMSALSIVFAVGLLIGGKLGDSYNKAHVLRNLQVLAAFGFLACAVCGFTWYLPYLIALAMGVLNGSWPVINALLADVAPVDRRKESFSLLYWGNNIGFSIGPLIAGFLFNRMPRALFVGNALALFVAAAVVTIFVKVDPAAKAADRAADAAPDDESTRGKKLSVFSIFRSYPVLLLYGISAVFTAFVYNQFGFTLPLFLNDLLGKARGPEAYGLVMTANGLTVVVFTMVVSFLSKKMSSLNAVALGSVFYALGFGAYYFARGLPFVLMATSVWTIGEILGATNGNAFIAERSPPAFRSRINSAISVAYIAGNALAPLAAGPLAKAFGSKSVWPLIAATALLSALMVFGVHRFDRKYSIAPSLH